jgi:hypothetical protein
MMVLEPENAASMHSPSPMITGLRLFSANRSATLSVTTRMLKPPSCLPPPGRSQC